MSNELSFRLTNPQRHTSCMVFASPHSGRDYPADFLEKTRLCETKIRSSEDAFVEDLFDAAPDHGAPLLAATKPRAYLDLNRATDELDPALIADIPAQTSNPRVSSGLGVIPRVVANGCAIYDGKIDMQEANARISRHWYPYHRQLEQLLAITKESFGHVVLVDCHSMPSEAVAGFRRGHSPRPDIVLGDRFGASAASWVSDAVESAFVSAGFKVARNTPFAGAFVLQQYGRPSRGQHAVQIEINRALYMHEEKIIPRDDFEAFRTSLSGVIAALCALNTESREIAAE